MVGLLEEEVVVWGGVKRELLEFVKLQWLVRMRKWLQRKAQYRRYK